jgi:anti-anti-sigma factor
MSRTLKITKAGVGAERDKIVVSIAGEIDTKSEEEIFDAVVALDAPTGTTIELELSEVSFVDSRGLTAILKVKGYLDA